MRIRSSITVNKDLGEEKVKERKETNWKLCRYGQVIPAFKKIRRRISLLNQDGEVDKMLLHRKKTR